MNADDFRKGHELEARTLAFSVAMVRFIGKFRQTPAEDVIARQLLKAATSIGANYREANRAESRPDFIHKTGLAEKEASETDYWLAVCKEAVMGPPEECTKLAQEARELLAIMTTINRKAKGR